MAVRRERVEKKQLVECIPARQFKVGAPIVVMQTSMQEITIVDWVEGLRRRPQRDKVHVTWSEGERV